MKITKGLITSAIILLISGISFAAGFLKEGVATEIEETKIAIADDESLVIKMNDKISDILIMDHLTLLEGRNKIQEAKNLAWEWVVNYDVLTGPERFLLEGEIENLVNSYNSILTFETHVGGIVDHFKIQGNNDDYSIADFDSDGFNYSISKLKFEEYDLNYSLSDTMTTEEFLLHYQFQNATDLDAVFSGSVTERIWVESLDLWTNLFRYELYEIQNRIYEYTTDIAILERKSSFYVFGITAITITTILASAMANRISDKESDKEFSPVKAKILEDDSLIITKTKNWPMILLLLALVLAIAGLIIPPIIGLLT
ncbi:MAG: hypothetical protein FK732_02550 [Asgard group archaeon]|nr:hypothetical protein [Asgard group archaeon]